LAKRHTAAVSGETAAFRHERNASASPSEHGVSEDHGSSVELRQAGSPDAEIKRAGSISNEELVDPDSLQGRRSHETATT
jgi:hypothetical protein